MSYKMVSIFIVLFLVVSVSLANKITLPMEEVATISHETEGTTQSRILAKLEVPSFPVGVVIDYSELKIPCFLHPDENIIMTLEGYTVTTEWKKETITWDFPWQTAGGDFDTLSLATFTFSSHNLEDIRLDITRTIQAWAGGDPNYGIILTRPYCEGDAFGPEIVALLSEIVNAEMVIYYTLAEH